MADLWMRNKMFGEDVMVVDCGYVKDAITRTRAAQLRQIGIGKRRFRCELMGRLFVEIPPTKRQLVLGQLPIQEGARYWGSTHHFQDT